jgi:hypothetical protein
MGSRNFLLAVACALALSFFAATTAPAEIINVTYAYSGTASGDPLNPPLIGAATGSLLPLGSMIWSDMAFPNLDTGAVDGTFKMTFTDGDTLLGTLHYQGDFSFPPPIVPFAQILTVTGGTGALLYYHGTLTGTEIANLDANTISASGAGTLDTVPEPDSVILLGTGLASLLAYRMLALLCR